MTEKAEIKQISTLGSKGTQIGIQNVKLGLSPTDAVQMALQIFHDYYPQLKNEVLEEIQQTVSNKLKNVPPENITSPNPRIALPTIQNACITPEKEIRELYEELLYNSMNSAVKKGVHPGFVEIIKQLCPDEAKILTYFKAHPRIPIVSLWFAKDGGGAIQQVKKLSNVGELTECEYPNNISSYFDNLSRLGLLNINENSPMHNKSLYEPLKKHPLIIDNSNNPLLSAFGFNTSRILEGYVELTDFGKTFCNICIEDKPLIIKQTDKTEE